jgi:hypothetical protein
MRFWSNRFIFIKRFGRNELIWCMIFHTT